MIDPAHMGDYVLAGLLAGHAALGLAAGLVYFHAVWWTARGAATHDGVVRMVGLTLGRFVALGAGLWLVSLEGALPLICTGAGIVAGRYLTVRRLRGEAE